MNINRGSDETRGVAHAQGTKAKWEGAAAGAEGAQPHAFREDCNWYVCADCHGKKGEKQWQCMLQALTALTYLECDSVLK